MDYDYDCDGIFDDYDVNTQINKEIFDRDTTTEEFRKCVKCEKMNIKSSEPKFKNMCLECFKNAKKEERQIFRPSAFRTCEQCNSNNIDCNKPLYIKKCDECMNPKSSIPSNFRVCERCRGYNIKISDPSWKKICYECFNQEKNNCLICPGCNLPKIKPSSPWQKMCYSCFKSSQQIPKTMDSVVTYYK